MPQTKNPYVAKFLLASSLALGLASPAFPQPPIGAPVPPHERHAFDGPMFGVPMPFLRDLQLTQAQEDQIFRIFHEQAPAMRERMKVARRAREDLDKAARTTKLDRARARELANAEAKALTDMALMHAENMSRVWEILTPEQRARLDERLERRPQRGPR